MSVVYSIDCPDPEHVRNLVLRGVFLMTQSELDWFYNGGAGRFFPEEWQKFVGLLPVEEQSDIISAYGKRLFGDDKAELINFARAWTGWESALASLESHTSINMAPAAYASAFARIENHYFANKGFLGEDGYIMKNIDIIKDIPGTIVQGRYDMICPPETAVRLHEAWPESRLIIASKSGHSLSEPQITSTLVSVMDELA